MPTLRLLPPFALLALLASCSEPANAEPVKPAAPVPATSSSTELGAKVLETMNSGEYTYVHLDQNGKAEWYAVPECEVAVGDQVTVLPGAMPMRGFESPTLGRTFDVIYFAPGLRKAGEAAGADMVQRAVEQAHAEAQQNAPAAAAVEPDSIAKADGGMTVAEIWARGAAGAGEQVALRGKVVKVNRGILGKNWLHLRDGTGAEGTNDLTVTTAGLAEVGDIVLVTGKLSADRDFGAGYSYPLILEDAEVVVETDR